MHRGIRVEKISQKQSRLSSNTSDKLVQRSGSPHLSANALVVTGYVGEKDYDFCRIHTGVSADRFGDFFPDTGFHFVSLTFADLDANNSH